MPSIQETMQWIGSEAFQHTLGELYGDQPGETRLQADRYQALVRQYEQSYGDGDVYLFSSPGRTEISGNHTDHNLGKVIAASINMDCVGAAAKNEENKVRIHSVTYNEQFVIDLNAQEDPANPSGTYTLVQGILEGFQHFGYSIGGADICLTSNVISAAGVSSSASFEMLIGTILNYFYNGNAMDIVTVARIGQYAENRRWNKQSGLLDQTACGYGGLISIDFREEGAPVIKEIGFGPIEQGYDLLIVATGENHADLSDEYSSIPQEMKAVAKELGAGVLRQVEKQDVLGSVQAVRAAAGDRALLRSLHFFAENDRVDRQIEALEHGQVSEFLRQVTASGNSSWKWLQNCYQASTPASQAITVYLALTELYIDSIGDGACRVHGGGFAGVIMALIPKEHSAAYKEYIQAMGAPEVYNVRIRKAGAVTVNLLN